MAISMPRNTSPITRREVQRFFPKLWAFNINWREGPERRIDSYVTPKGCLTKAGMPNHGGSHEAEWRGVVPP